MDGRISPLDAPVVRGDDSAFAEGRGCYTTARVSAGLPRFAERHARRLARDARRLRIGDLDEGSVRRALEELAAAAFPDAEGVVRLQASRDGDGRAHLVGVPRALNDEPAEWSAILAPFPHEGPMPYGGRKVSNRLLHVLAAEAARDAGADEALMLDAGGLLVEGSRTNLFVGAPGGGLQTPPLARGAVAGIAREVALERVAGIAERDVSRAQLFETREIVAVNAVRGARPITRLEGRPVGDGAPGAWFARLSAAFAADAVA